MENIAVSVIVPVYKAEGTIEATVKSIQAQTHKNIEIILVDDGSPDKSCEICDKLAFSDNRIKVIHKQNGGVSSARNEGIIQATSEFLCFVDSDDEIETTMVEKLLRNQISTGAQLVVAGITEYHKNLIRTVCEDECQIDFSNATNEQIINLCSKDIMCFSTVKLYSKKILVDNNIKFKENLVCGEDHLLIFQYLCYIEKISFIKDSLYRYYCFNSNGSTRFFPLSGQIDIFKAKEKFVRKNCPKESADEYCAKNALRNLIARFNYLAKRSIKDYDELSKAYDTYWIYIAPFLHKTELFSEEDRFWLVKNKNNLVNKNIKAVYYCIEKELVFKKSKRMRHLSEFLDMSIKEKIKFVFKKIKLIH